jgi:hypothetical protein
LNAERLNNFLEVTQLMRRERILIQLLILQLVLMHTHLQSNLALVRGDLNRKSNSESIRPLALARSTSFCISLGVRHKEINLKAQLSMYYNSYDI